jgi:gas vesicle protein
MVVASFRHHADALRAVEALRSSGISENEIVVTRKAPGVLETLLPEHQRSGQTTIEVRNRRSQASSEIASAKAAIDTAAADMNETIRAIQDRLNPEAVKARAKHALKEATVGRVERTIGDVNDRISGGGGGVMDRIKQNPMPAALAGIGLTWLLMSKRSSNAGRPGYYQPVSHRYPSDRTGVGHAAAAVADKAGNAAQQVSSTIGQTTDKVTGTIGDTASQVGNTVGDTASQVGDTVTDAAQEVRSTASQWASQAGQQAQRVQGSLSRTMEENPLPVGLAVLGLGALVAALMPKTSTEEQFLGGTHDRLIDTAQQVTQKVGRIAERAGTAATQEAKSQNLA